MFRSRSRVAVDWLPLAWAFAVFVQQIQYMWGVIELSAYQRTWTLLDFLLFVTLSLSLYVAGSLILPDVQLRAGETLAESFEKDGRRALVALSLWSWGGLVVDWRLFGLRLVSFSSALIVSLAVVPLLFLMAKRRRTKVVATLAYVLFSLLAAWLMSPKAY